MLHQRLKRWVIPSLVCGLGWMGIPYLTHYLERDNLAWFPKTREHQAEFDYWVKNNLATNQISFLVGLGSLALPLGVSKFIEIQKAKYLPSPEEQVLLQAVREELKNV